MPVDPDLTPILEIPYADAGNPAEVHTYQGQMALKIEELLLAGDLNLWSPGDFKFSSRAASHGRWLLCDGRELTQAEIESELGLNAGDAADFVTLWGTGGSSIYGSAATGKVKLPDPRGRVSVGVGSGSGLTARTRGQSGGAETVTLTGAQSGLKAHSHGVTDPGHTHDDGSLAVASHTHGDGTLTAASAGAHTHSHTFNYYNSNIGLGSLPVLGTAGGLTVTLNNNSAGAHTHDVTGATGAASPDVTGATASASTGVTVNQAPAADAAESHTNMQPWLALGSLFVRV